jgi:hypothetical protein
MADSLYVRDLRLLPKALVVGLRYIKALLASVQAVVLQTTGLIHSVGKSRQL